MGQENLEATTVLVAEDDSSTRKLYRSFLEKEGFSVIEAENGREALEKISSRTDLAVLDLQMPQMDGLSCLKQIQSRFPDCGLLMISGNGDIPAAVDAIKSGAIDFVQKPCVREDFVARVENAIRTQQLKVENARLRQAVEQLSTGSSIIMNSEISSDLARKIDKVATIDSTVLLTGESGTGKTTIARMIHDRSQRKDAPFVTVNCAALPRELIEAELFGHVRGAFTGATQDRPGRVEVAKGGTLFLDEIGDLPLELQPKLLTLIQDQTFQRVGSNKTLNANLRFISATHQDLEEMCRSKAFRSDLFYRLNVLPLRVPALRERSDDVHEMAEAILCRIAKRRDEAPARLTPESVNALVRYGWPGNIRELENVLERASAFCEENEIGLEDLSLPSAPTMPDSQERATMISSAETLLDLEKRAVKQAIEDHNGNRARAARQLGISEKGLYNKLRRFGFTEKKQ